MTIHDQLDVSVAYDSDIDRVVAGIEEVAGQMYREASYKDGSGSTRLCRHCGPRRADRAAEGEPVDLGRSPVKR